jgi:hypothetical protein
VQSCNVGKVGMEMRYLQRMLTSHPYRLGVSLGADVILIAKTLDVMVRLKRSEWFLMP